MQVGCVQTLETYPRFAHQQVQHGRKSCHCNQTAFINHQELDSVKLPRTRLHSPVLRFSALSLPELVTVDHLMQSEGWQACSLPQQIGGFTFKSSTGVIQADWMKPLLVPIQRRGRAVISQAVERRGWVVGVTRMCRQCSKRDGGTVVRRATGGLGPLHNNHDVHMTWKRLLQFNPVQLSQRKSASLCGASNQIWGKLPVGAVRRTTGFLASSPSSSDSSASLSGSSESNGCCRGLRRFRCFFCLGLFDAKAPLQLADCGGTRNARKRKRLFCQHNSTCKWHHVHPFFLRVVPCHASVVQGPKQMQGITHIRKRICVVMNVVTTGIAQQSFSDSSRLPQNSVVEGLTNRTRQKSLTTPVYIPRSVPDTYHTSLQQVTTGCQSDCRKCSQTEHFVPSHLQLATESDHQLHFLQTFARHTCKCFFFSLLRLNVTSLRVPVVGINLPELNHDIKGPAVEQSQWAVPRKTWCSQTYKLSADTKSCLSAAVHVLLTTVVLPEPPLPDSTVTALVHIFSTALNWSSSFLISSKSSLKH